MQSELERQMIEREVNKDKLVVFFRNQVKEIKEEINQHKNDTKL